MIAEHAIGEQAYRELGETLFESREKCTVIGWSAEERRLSHTSIQHVKKGCIQIPSPSSSHCEPPELATAMPEAGVSAHRECFGTI
jgi:hypothetical protein